LDQFLLTAQDRRSLQDFVGSSLSGRTTPGHFPEGTSEYNGDFHIADGCMNPVGKLDLALSEQRR
jgi:hypothetical protein